MGTEFSKVMTLGSIGKDKVGGFITDQLRQENLLFDFYEDPHALTGQCAVTVMKADRTCIAILDACENYPKEHIEGVLTDMEQEIIDETVCFYSTAFFIESNW